MKCELDGDGVTNDDGGFGWDSCSKGSAALPGPVGRGQDSKTSKPPPPRRAFLSHRAVCDLRFLSKLFLALLDPVSVQQVHSPAGRRLWIGRGGEPGRWRIGGCALDSEEDAEAVGVWQW